MWRLLLLITAALGVVLAKTLTSGLRRPLAWLMRALGLALAAALGVAAATIAAAGIENGTWWPVVTAAAMALVALRLGWASKPREQARSRVERGAREPIPPPDSRWQRFEAGLDWRSRAQARRAHAQIDGLVAERNSPSLTHDHRALLLSCEKRVPELLETCLERCRNARREEQQDYRRQTLERLVQIAGRAAQARSEIRSADDHGLEVLHRYFDNVGGLRQEQPSGR